MSSVREVQVQKARHGVDVGSSYLHRNACRDFVHSIAESKRLSSISKANFFSLRSMRNGRSNFVMAEQNCLCSDKLSKHFIDHISTSAHIYTHAHT